MKTVWILRVFVFILILAGCGQGNEPVSSTPQNHLPADEPSASSEDRAQSADQPIELTPLPLPTHDFTEGTAMPAPSNSVLTTLIETAIEDLAGRLSIPADQIELREAADVTWPDSSLGCPQPGMAYAEVLSPGYLVRLNANGLDFEYHAGKNGDIFLCNNPTPPIPGMSSQDK